MKQMQKILYRSNSTHLYSYKETHVNQPEKTTLGNILIFLATSSFQFFKVSLTYTDKPIEQREGEKVY